MSRKSLEMVQCPSCGKDFEVEIYNSINVSLDPELRESLISGDLNSVKCPCGHNVTLKFPLLYHKMGFNGVMLQYTESDPKTILESCSRSKEFFNMIMPSTSSNVFEIYNDWKEFADRVKQIG